MGLFDNIKIIADNYQRDVFFRGMSRAIDDYTHWTGKYPEAILVGIDVYRATQGDSRMLHYPGRIVEFEGIRVLSAFGLEGKFYLIGSLHEIPPGYFPELTKEENT